MGNTDILDQTWAEYLLDKYQEEYDLTLTASDDIFSILQKLMYEKGFECDQETFKDIVDTLIRNYL